MLVITKLKGQVKSLKITVDNLNGELAIKLNQSVAYQQQVNKKRQS